MFHSKFKLTDVLNLIQDPNEINGVTAMYVLWSLISCELCPLFSHPGPRWASGPAHWVAGRREGKEGEGGGHSPGQREDAAS